MWQCINSIPSFSLHKVRSGVKQVPKKKTETEIYERRLNLYLDPDLARALNDYCLAYMQKRKRIIESIRQMVGRAALTEWLQKHGSDLSIEFGT